MFRMLLVPLDRSPLAEQAVAPAAEIARACGAAIDLVIAQPRSSLSGLRSSASNDARWNADHRYIESKARGLAAGASLPVTHAAVRGDPEAVICERANAIGADLIVMTSHGRGGLSRACLGSVTDAVVRQAAIPVLVLHAGDGGRGLVADYKNILVPLDESPLTADILPAAAALAKVMGAMLTLLEVVSHVPTLIPADPTLPYTVMPMIPDEVATEQLVNSTMIALTAIARRCHEQYGVATQAAVVTNEHEAEAIIAFARRQRMDAIAMSTHGRGATRWLLGSVADKVLRSTGLPVLLRRPNSVRSQRENVEGPLQAALSS